MRYVAGFLFDSLGTHVVLVRKNRPLWQAGKLNGVGGKIEPGETPAEAMAREFLEEAGIFVDWHQFAVLTAGETEVNFFRCRHSDALAAVRTVTDEAIEVHDVYRLPAQDLIPNLRWLIPMALAENIAQAAVTEERP